MTSPRPNFNDTRVVVGAAEIAVRSAGDRAGPVVVALPSLGRSGRDFDALAATLVDRGYRVVLPEPRGIAGSTGPLEGLTLHDLAADIAVAIREATPKHVTLIGHAFGNRLARTLATDHPALVSQLVLIAAGGLIPIREPIVAAMIGCLTPTLPRAERLKHLQTAFFAPGNDPSVWLDGWWPETALTQTAAVRATPVEDWWEAGGKPMTILQAEFDAIATRENADDLKRRLGDRVKIIDITNAGHAMLPEQPEQIARAVLSVLPTPSR